MSTILTRVAEGDPRKGVSLLSLDAGGPRGISQLQILKHIMEELSSDADVTSPDIVKKPCQVFAAIGGSGTGGLIAILLAVLEMTVDEALEEFTGLVIKVFKDIDKNPKAQSQKLKEAMMSLLKKRNIDETWPLIPSSGASPVCRLIVPIMYKNHIGTICMLNNYIDSQGPPTKLTILEAMLTTCATPPLFDSTKISKDFSTFEYVSADLGLSNPVREIIAAAHRVFGGDRVVPCLLSIGCGHPGVTVTPPNSNISSRIAFLERIAMDGERVAQEIGGQMGKLALYHRFSASYGMEMYDYRSWKEPDEIIAHTAMYLNDLEVFETIIGCLNTLRDAVGFTTLEQLRHSGGGEILPPEMLQLTSNYVERKAPMEFIENSIFEGGAIKTGSKRIIVTAMGGCGKTQLVRKFIEVHGERFASVFFVDGTSKDTIIDDLVRYVRSLSAAQSQASFEESMRFLSLPAQDGERLLIIDNVDDPKLNLQSFLPRWKTGTVMITSRNDSHGQLGPSFHLRLDVMSLDESIELLARGSGRTSPLMKVHADAAKEVAEELGYLPIALVQAASYMFTTGCSMEAYILRLRTSRERILNDPATGQVDMRYQTAFAAFDASYDTLPRNAQKTLHLLSFFNRQKFPVECINLAAENGFSTERYHYLDRGDEFESGINCLKEIFYSSGEWDPADLDSTVASLRSQSLVTVVATEATRLLYMHPLVHEWGRIRLLKDDARHFQYAAVRLVSCGAGSNNYTMIQYLYPHVQALSPVWNEMHVNDIGSFSHILTRSGFDSYSLKLFERMLEILKDRLGMEHPDTILASGNLTATYRRSGRYEEAEKLQVEALGQSKKLLGIDHPYTILASGNLAATYRQLGRYEEAEKLEVEVLSQRTRLLGIDHPETILASANLAATYRRSGRYREAEKQEVEVLRQRTRLLGIDHPHTINASANLAVTYRDLGLYEEAKKLNMEVLRRRTRLLGIDHPAEEMQIRVLQSRKTLLGDKHPETLRGMLSLAYTFRSLQKQSEAFDLAERARDVISETLGARHPLFQDASDCLAYIDTPARKENVSLYM